MPVPFTITEALLSTDQRVQKVDIFRVDLFDKNFDKH